MKQWCALYVFLYSYGVWLHDLDLHFEDQGGFRKQHSTELTTSESTDQIRLKTPSAWDLSKALDTVR